MSQQHLWYEDDESPEQIARRLLEMRQQREEMTEEQRLEIAAFLLEGMEPEPKPKREPIPADAATEDQQGYGTGEASGPRAPSGANSAAILAEFQSGRRRRGDPDHMRDYLTAALNEAAGA